MATPLNTIKSWFQTGLKPTQNQFWEWLDSFWHKDDEIPMESIDQLENVLNGKVDKVQGKSLSSNDYTDEDKDKLSSVVMPRDIRTFRSLEEALNELGENQYFLWAEDNHDGVVSPAGTQLGITKSI